MQTVARLLCSVTRELDDEELTSQTVKIIGDDITDAYNAYLISTYRQWDDYLESIRTATDESLEQDFGHLLY